MNPTIGISVELNSDPRREREFRTGYDLEFQIRDYAELVHRYGGCPIFLSSFAEERPAGILAALDGLLLSGGSDLDPGLWNEEALQALEDPDSDPEDHVQTLGEDHRRRSACEHNLLLEALRADLPVFGICRGMQQINVSLGGSLWQDLHRQRDIRGHFRKDRPRDLVHQVRITDPSALPLALPENFRVNSTHHQALREPGRGLRVFARDPEQPEVVEGLTADPRLPDSPAFLLGVQWHPERIPDEESSRRLMEAFIAAAKKRCAGAGKDTGGGRSAKSPEMKAAD